MEIKFKNTYYVSCLVLNGREIDIDLVEYNTFEDFAEFLKSKRIGFKRIDHDNTYWYISEKDYSSVADWHHGELEDYMRENLDERWSEDAESCFFAQGLTLEEMFNQLKQIDEVELELICEVEPGDYIKSTKVHIDMVQLGARLRQRAIHRRITSPKIMPVITNQSMLVIILIGKQ